MKFVFKSACIYIKSEFDITKLILTILNYFQTPLKRSTR